MIKEDKIIEPMYVVYLNVEVVGPDYYNDGRPVKWNFNKLLGYYEDPSIADDDMEAFIKSEKFKALEKKFRALDKVAHNISLYKKAVPAFDFDAAYNMIDDVIEQIKKVKE